MDSGGYAVVPKAVIQEKRKIKFMYREEPAGGCDSGWRFFSGEESDEYLNDPDNFGFYELSMVAKIDEDIIPCLSAPVGSIFGRENVHTPFTPGTHSAVAMGDGAEATMQPVKEEDKEAAKRCIAKHLFRAGYRVDEISILIEEDGAVVSRWLRDINLR